MGNIWFTSALWIGLALLSSLISSRVAISVALIAIMIGAAIFSRLTGYADTHDAERLSVDPTMRPVVGARVTERRGLRDQPDGSLQGRGVDEAVSVELK